MDSSENSDATLPIAEQQQTNSTTSSSHAKADWRPFYGIINDFRRRAPYYWSDWKDAWDYRVVPATTYMYFANLLPAIAFSFDMFIRTDDSFGVNEVLLAQVIGCCAFAAFATQPLVIVGITGPVAIFAYTIYDIVIDTGYDYFAFWAWVGIWSFILHTLLAVFNACNTLTWVTRFPCDTFGLYIAFVYLQKGVEVLLLQWDNSSNDSAAPYLSIMTALLVMLFGFGAALVGESKLFYWQVRKILEDYATPLTIIFFSGFVHIGYMREVDLQNLPTRTAFSPTTDRKWLVPFWDLEAGGVFLALPFAVAITILFYFDHNVSSLISQGSEFPLRKPPGFHWDYLLLGIVMFVCGILGLPFPNGLIPQGPLHTKSLCVSHTVTDEKGEKKQEVSHVVEQRVSHMAQGLLFLVTMAGPFLFLLNLIPQAVLAGLFFIMGLQSLVVNGVVAKIHYLCIPDDTIVEDHPLKQCRRRTVYVFVGIQILTFAAAFAVTQTVAAIGFPIFIVLMIPLRVWWMPKWFREEELKALDSQTASDFVMKSLGKMKGID